MKEEHSSALDLQIFGPPFFNVANEIWVGELDRRGDRILEGLCRREGKDINGFFWSLALPYGIKFTLRVCPRTMSR